MKLTNNTIFITGGSSGIGRALAEALHHCGNQVIISGRRSALLQQVVAENLGMDYVELDVTSPQQIKTVAQQLTQKYPQLNVLINNAGVMPFDNPASGEFDDATLVNMVNTNLLAPARISAAFVEHLKLQPQSYIINNSSILAFLPLATNALYSATKAAVHSYTMSQRFTLRNTSVQVLEIAPPWVDTDLIYKSGDPRAMPLDSFIRQVMKKLSTDDLEILVDSVAAVRDNPGSNEHTLFNQFNISVVDTPIPVHP